MIIELLKESDIPFLDGIISEVFGSDYIKIQKIIDLGSTIYVAKRDAEVVGFITYKELSDEEKSVHKELNCDGKRVVKVGQLAIAPKFQKMGYGMKLMDMAVSQNSNKVDIITMTAWEERGNVNIAMIANAFGFQPVSKLEQALEGTYCKHCGDSCKCSGVLYKLVLSSKK